MQARSPPFVVLTTPLVRAVFAKAGTMSGQPQRVQRMMTLPINIIFRLLQHKQRVQLWLYDHTDLRIEGRIVGLDEYMNLVLDDASEISVKKQTKRKLGRTLLKGDSITLIQAAPTEEEQG